MNYLAHLFLSDHQESVMVGNFIADFVRKSTWQHFPMALQRGIFLHHEIDKFTDSHPIVQQSVSRLRPQFQKYAPVIIDVFYDHFLSVHWQKFTTQDRYAFCQEVYWVLDQHKSVLPSTLHEHLPEMISRNWLYYYAEELGVRRSLQNLSHRSTHRKDLDTALFALKADYKAYEDDFLAFFPLLHTYCRDWLKN